MTPRTQPAQPRWLEHLAARFADMRAHPHEDEDLEYFPHGYPTPEQLDYAWRIIVGLLQPHHRTPGGVGPSMDWPGVELFWHAGGYTISVDMGPNTTDVWILDPERSELFGPLETCRQDLLKALDRISA